METGNENVFEFLRGQEVMTVTLSQGRFVSKVKKLAQKYPDEINHHLPCGQAVACPMEGVCEFVFHIPG